MSYQIGTRVYDHEGSEDELITDIELLCRIWRETDIGTPYTINEIIKILTDKDCRLSLKEWKAQKEKWKKRDERLR